MNVGSIAVRPLADDKIEIVESRFPSGDPEKHKRRFAEQLKGRALYLFAWLGKSPLGHALLKWSGTTDEPMMSKLKDCPDISDLFVDQNHRSKGIGSLLLETAETLAKEHNYSQIGLSVGVDNVRARVLYQRRGYRDSGLGQYQETGRYKDREGNEQLWQEICIYLVKQLESAI